MAKKILAIGVNLASEEVEVASFSDKTSLLDWDIVLFRPDILSYKLHATEYMGRPRLSDSSSFAVKEASEHWRREIKEAVESGKTVIAFLPPVQDVYIATGERKYSGTGKNRAVTHVVSPYSNYESLPADFAPTNANGTSVKLAPKAGDILASYWAEIGEYSEYRVLLSGNGFTPCLLTRNGDKPVGAILRSKGSNGTLVCVPDVDFDREEFTRTEVAADGEEEEFWTEQADRFSGRLISAVVGLHSAFHSQGEVTPEPAWAGEPTFVLPMEPELRSELLEVETQLEELQKRKEQRKEDLWSAGQLRGLLYEKGKPLENAIIQVLKLLRFSAKPYKEGHSEFDVVFESPEGRLLGEAEGKDSKAVNIDKLRQLSMNINEDLQREEVTAPAKGVLFGNAYRFVPPPEREPQFTEKCVLAAKAAATALVATSDLFAVAQYLSAVPDEVYATECRCVLLSSAGPTIFPPVPGIPPGPEVRTAT